MNSRLQILTKNRSQIPFYYEKLKKKKEKEKIKDTLFKKNMVKSKKSK